MTVRVRVGETIITDGIEYVVKVVGDKLVLSMLADIPTEPGVYAPGPDRPRALTACRSLLLTTSGKWYWFDVTGSKADAILEETTPAVVSRYCTSNVLFPMLTEEARP